MNRRDARERREFAYRKVKDLQKQQAEEKKRLEEKNKPAQEKGILTAKAPGAQPSDMDDEYRWAGCEDPVICVTTSHEPSIALKKFCVEVATMIPNAIRINRGNHGVKDVFKACKANNVTDVIFLHETRGKPDAMIISHLPHGPTAFFSLHNVVMRHSLPNVGRMPNQYPHLVFHGLNSKIGARVTNILKYLFPVPKRDSKRVVFFGDVDREDYVFFRNYVVEKNENSENELREVGPRFALFLYSVINDTFENERAAQAEFSYRPYLRRAKKMLSVDEVETEQQA